MIRTLSEYESRGGDGLPGFLAETSLDRDRQEDSEPEKEGVTLITFHAAKGLEFPHVFLVGIEESILPHARSKLEGSIDEERRLFYVGITRAMRTLAISYCVHRKKYGSPTPCYPSSFLKDLDPRYTEIVNFHELTTKPANDSTARSHFAKMRALLTRKDPAL
jgi:superfamily I DNA/RNA helicase